MLPRWRRSVMSTVLLVLASSARADVYEHVEKPTPDVQVGIRLNRTTVPLSGHVLLTIVVVGPAPVEVEAITELVASKEWEGTSEGKPEITPRPEQRARWRQTFRLDPFPLDKDKKLPLTVAPIRYRTGAMKAGEWREQAFPPVDITITSTVVAPHLDDARGITGIEQVPAPPSWAAWQIGAAVIIATLTGVALAVWRWRSRVPAAIPELPPGEWALSELERLNALELSGPGQVERYHTLLSDVLRRYIERRFGLRAPEQTTPEFLEGLRRSGTLPPPQQEALRDFLQRCDLAKFARAEFSAAECWATASTAGDFIRQTITAAPNGQPAKS